MTVRTVGTGGFIFVATGTGSDVVVTGIFVATGIGSDLVITVSVATPKQAIWKHAAGTYPSRPPATVTLTSGSSGRARGLAHPLAMAVSDTQTQASSAKSSSRNFVTAVHVPLVARESATLL